MSTLIRFRQLLTAVAVWLSVFLGTGILAHAAVDTSVTQRVWKLKFGVTDAQMYNGGNSANGLNMTWLNADADGDGIKNIDEITTGTSPFNPGKTIAITSVVRNGSNVELQFPTENGKLYRVEFTTTLANAGSWALHASPTPGQWIGNGSTLMFSLPYAANTFYRVRVDELDSDGDGVSDWVESETSLNPNSMTTVAGVNDHDYVTGQLALPSVVSIHATKSFASEDGPDAGTFTVSRTQKLLPITVNLTPSGTAVAGSDYSALPASVTFTSGIDSVPVPVNPVPDSVVEGSKSVTASLQAPGGSGQPPFTLSANASATVIINDSTVPTGTGLLARYYDTAGGIYADAVNFGQSGTFTYTRVGASAPFTGSTIVIPFTYNGSPALQVGHLVKLTFTSGSLNSTTFNHQNYTVTAVNPGVNFTVGISGATLPTSYNPTGSFSIQSFPHPAIIERVDPVVDFDWAYGTPNDVGVTPNNPVDNYSTVFEGHLHPTTAGNYQFQLDADDKARVLVDLNLNGTFDLPGEEILEHGWDGATTPETVGTFKASAVIPLVIPGTPAQRYKIRVEHVETTGDARCRLQWREGANGYANIPQANVFSHTRALTNYTVSSSVATINTAVAHGLTANVSTVTLYFTSGSLFTPPANYSGTYTVASVVDADTFTISVPGAANQASAAAGFMADTTSTATGWLSRVFTNTSFTAPAGYVGVLGAGATNANNGLWGSGTPDPVLIGKDTFSIRWTGQVQPQFSEDYTFVVFADDGTSLRINGQVQEMETVPSTSIGNGTYDYSSTNGDTVVTYTNVVVKPGSYIVGETVRVDPTSANLTHGTGSTYTFDGVTGYLTVNYSNLTNITPGGFTPGETIELDPTGGTLTTLPNLPYVIFDEPSNSTFRVFVGTGLYDSQTTAPEATINIADTRNAVVTKVAATGATYSGYNSSTGVATITYSSITGIAPGSFTNGMTVELDPTSNALAPLTNGSYVVSGATATTFNVTFPTAMAGTNSGSINIASSSNGVIPASITTAFTINFGTGKYSTGTGNINVEIVDKPLKEWSSMGNERYVRIPMIGGVRYDIQLDFWESGGYSRCKLYWFSPSQPKQIIPAERLYPSSVPQAPTAHISSTDATALVNGAFSVPIAGSNGGSVSLSGNPAWLTYANGVLSGTPPAGTAGDYQVTITITNANGTSTSVVNIHVEDTGGTIVREYWNGVSGSSVANIPTSTTPSGTSNLGSLEAPTDFGDDYGTRIRGYITAPETGNYYFWIAASGAAELWISNDDEPINAFKRAWVNTGSATPQTWSAEANQKSPWLALEQGKKYYVEILHKAGTGIGDNLAIGWAKPGQSTNAPNQVVPGYALSTYTPPAPGSTPGTLYLATMLSQSGAATSGVGSSTLRLSDDGASAIMKYSYSGLTGPITSQHIHTDPYLTHPSTIVFDIDTPETPGDGLQPDGSYKWTITPIGTLSAADIVEIIKQGKAYINLHTAAYPAGEIRGNYTLANGSRTFTTPPAPPSWTDDHTDAAAAARFLTQATFGPRISDITTLQGMASYDAWIEDQFTKSTSLHLPEVIRTENASAQGGAFATALTFNAWWWRSITGDDQLRQRIAFALSEIHVVSGQGPLENNALALSYFYDKLATNAFGNFRDILEDTTLTPSMGRYLDMLRNDKPDQTVGRIPNENYAREIKQLFSVGLYRMWPDGTLMLTSKDAPIDTYTQREIIGFAHVFTGWDYGYDGALHSSFSSTTNWTRQMRETPARHYTGPKRILNNEVLPGIPSLGGQPLDPLATHTSNDYNDPAYTALPGLELDLSHDQLFNHPNTGPFICRQLIQRLVTSHPSRDYLYRVVQKFNDNGSGVRGDMQAVIKAILLDYEARSPDQITKPAFGKQREPVMRVAAAARAFRTDTWAGTYSQSASPSSTSRNITVTTTTPHKLVGGNNVLLDFTSGSPAPWIGSYQVLSSPAPTTNSFTVTAQGWATGTYSIPANSTTCTVTMSSHWLQVGHQVYIDFTSGTADGDAGLDNVVYTLATATAETGAGNFTFTIAGAEVSASARSGNVMLPRFSPGSFTTAASGLPAPQDRRVTMDTNVDHHLNVGDQVQLNFYGGFPQPTDMVATVESVVDLNTWTFLASGTGTGLSPNQGYDQVFQFPLVSQPLTRSGNVGSRPSTYAVGETTSTIDQSPLNSPTVFNFFLPDFKYPGALASQGITTPEFQTTAETTVIRQANYLYNGIFNPANTNGISSFNTGNNALVMDLSPWMTNTTTTDLGLGAPTNAAKPWTNNENISALIDQLNILLVAGQLSPQAKTIIRNFVAQPITSISTHASACTVTTSGNHSLNTGDIVVISGVNGGTFGGTANALNSTTTNRTVTVTGPNTFTIPISCTVAPTSVAAAHVSVVPYNNATTTTTSAPSDTHKRDRLRAIIHLILTSPDFTIQR